MTNATSVSAAVLLIMAGCNQNDAGSSMPQRWDSAVWSPEQIQRLEAGRRWYTQRCAACHQASGEGQLTLGAPALKGSAVVRGPVAQHINIVLNGRGNGAMPAFGKALDTRTIADIINYERNAWGNSDPWLITAAEVEARKPD